jgi:ABC-type transport system substrate-binding protein/tRNA A-37 threonylcarbamoyl transferase component Bud32
MRSGLSIGAVFAGFHVEALIGEGAMGAVYRAVDAHGTRAALKVLVPELARDERFRNRFLRESKLAATLDHPNIVSTLGAGEEDSELYLAMEYVQGPDLRGVLRREGRLGVEQALDLLGQVAAALDAAHAKGLVHRDVKPGNILLDEPTGHVYVCDFGLARHVSSVSSLTGDRGFVGTIDYVPPEQVEGGPIDGRADVYSLGCVLFECLTGTRPFERDSELAVVFAHLNEPPPRLSDIRSDLPEAFDHVFATALAKAPNDRYTTCSELINAARAASQGKVIVRRKVRRLRMLVAAGATLAVAGASIGTLVATGVLWSAGRPGAPHPALALRPNALNLIDSKTHRLIGSVRSADRTSPGDIVFAGGSAWVRPNGKQRIERVDPDTKRVTATVKLPWLPGLRLARGAGSVWVTEDLGSHVWRIDGRSAKVLTRINVGEGGVGPGIAYGAGSLWLAHGSDVLRVNPRTGQVMHRYPAGSWWLVFADGAVWAATSNTGVVSKIDPIDNRVVARTKLHGWLSDLSVGGGSVWVSLQTDGVIYKLDENDLHVESSSSSGVDPERLTFGAGKLWIADTASQAVSLLDQVSGERQQLAAAAEPTTALYHNGVVWTGGAAPPAPLPPIQGLELRIATPTDTAVDIDPMGGKTSVQQFMYATCANLLNYPDSAGPEGTELRPEIAAAMPTLSADGRTYTFTIRPGFRFSPPSDEEVTAQTFRHTIERALSRKNIWSGAPPLASDIVGVPPYRNGRAGHISGLTVRGNTLSIKLVRPAGDFLTRISMPAFCPVPLSVPIHTKGLLEQPIPSAGPYYISSYQDHRTVLERNPNYPGDRPRNPERIVYLNDIPTPQAVASANAGDFDLLPQDFDNTTSLSFPGGVLDRRYGSASAAAKSGRQQYFSYAAPVVDYIVFNTRRPLFRNVLLRRAVNSALDRRALAAAYADAPDDQIVPPAVPGFRAGRVYPVGDRDLAVARRLAGTKLKHAVLFFCGDPRLPALARIVQSNLAAVEIKVTLSQSSQCPTGEAPTIHDPKAASADLYLASSSTLFSEVRDPAPFLDLALSRSLFGSAPPPGPWNRPSFRRQLERARVLRGVARREAYRRLDDELMRMAPFAVFGSWVWSEYFSPKTGCKLFQAEYGFVDLGALCTKS